MQIWKAKIILDAPYLAQKTLKFIEKQYLLVRLVFNKALSLSID